MVVSYLWKLFFERTLTDKPWRTSPDFGPELEKTLKDDIQNIRKHGKLSILMVGPIHAGKSSFINSVSSIGQGFPFTRAPTGKISGSFTTTYDVYFEKSILAGFRLGDTMGMGLENQGLHVKDFENLLNGHIKNNYQFDIKAPIDRSSKFYNPNPKLEDRIHCVVFVADSQFVANEIDKKYLMEIRAFNEVLQKTKIPKMLILTKADLLCDEVKENVGLMFRSVAVRDVVQKASEAFDIGKSSIHPVVNYQESFAVTAEQNCPLLYAVRQMAVNATKRIEWLLEQ